tara:strand:- start:327 stop:515 length:189 start_codon:yes stop_codon:yes gene_type:complete
MEAALKFFNLTLKDIDCADRLRARLPQNYITDAILRTFSQHQMLVGNTYRTALIKELYRIYR